MVDYDQDVTVPKGDDVSIRVTITDSPDGGGSAIDLTGSNVEWVLKSYPDSSTEILSEDSDSGSITLTDAANGVATLTLTDTETSTLDRGVVYHHEFDVVDSAGLRSTVCVGEFSVR